MKKFKVKKGKELNDESSHRHYSIIAPQAEHI